METREEQLQAIRDRAKREAAEKAQRNAASSRIKARKQEPTFTMGHLALALVVGVGLVFIYANKEDKPGDLERIMADVDWQAISEARIEAVGEASMVQLLTQGANPEDLDFLNAETQDGTTYKLLYQHNGRRLEIFAKHKCDPLDMEQLRRPACWEWY